MSVSAIVVNYYTAALLPELCASLHGQDFLQELVIVENSREYISTQFLEKKSGFPVRVLENKANVGFAVAVNQAIQKVCADFVLIVNPDARLLKGCVRAMVQTAQMQPCPLVGPRFYWDDEKLFRLPPATGDNLWLGFAGQSAGGFALDAELLSFYWTLRHERFWSMQEPFFEPFLSGACLLVDTSWIREMHNILFDERFFLYYEDTDLCVRAMAQGIRPMCAPEAGVIHYWNQSPDPALSKSELIKKARNQFMEKHYGKLTSYPEITESVSSSLNFSEPGKENNLPFFCWDAHILESKNIYFEFGLNPYFVPFAQANVTENCFTLPVPIHERLFPGNYYFRLRSPVSGLKKIWKWNKK